MRRWHRRRFLAAPIGLLAFPFANFWIWRKQRTRTTSDWAYITDGDDWWLSKPVPVEIKWKLEGWRGIYGSHVPEDRR